MVFLGYVTLGLLAGVLAGSFGIGGGTLIVPILIIVFSQSYENAVGTSLMVIIAIAFAGAFRHWTLDNVNLRIVLFVALGGVIGAILGANIVENLSPAIAKKALAIILVISAIRLWI
ncbi:TSUP family transporter [candidate division KSB1 bacterium]|nr:TSUP family transporter [candidate division KSB1 bacterium]